MIIYHQRSFNNIKYLTAFFMQSIPQKQCYYHMAIHFSILRFQCHHMIPAA